MTLEFKKDKMEYVYKYENINNTVVYVGITNNLTRRIREHQEDKLGEIKKPTIYYFPVKYRGDADMLETYLIDYYKTGKYYNEIEENKFESIANPGRDVPKDVIRRLIGRKQDEPEILKKRLEQWKEVCEILTNKNYKNLLKLNGEDDDEKKLAQLIIDAVGYNS